MDTHIKDPDATLDYGFDWSGELSDDTISSSSWAVDVAGLAIETDSHDDTNTVVWVSGGTSGVNYRLTNSIQTADGRKDDRSKIISVVER